MSEKSKNININADTDIKFSSYDDLSFFTTDGWDHCELYISHEYTGNAEIWTDVENEHREYIILNNEIIYLDTLIDEGAMSDFVLEYGLMAGQGEIPEDAKDGYEIPGHYWSKGWEQWIPMPGTYKDYYTPEEVVIYEMVLKNEFGL